MYARGGGACSVHVLWQFRTSKCFPKTSLDRQHSLLGNSLLKTALCLQLTKWWKLLNKQQKEQEKVTICFISSVNSLQCLSGKTSCNLCLAVFNGWEFVSNCSLTTITQWLSAANQPIFLNKLLYLPLQPLVLLPTVINNVLLSSSHHHHLPFLLGPLHQYHCVITLSGASAYPAPRILLLKNP